MRLLRDLGPRLIYLKGALFLLMALVSSVLLVFEDGRVTRVFLVLVLAWSAARFYYFMFYVIERYVDPDFRFSGLGSFLGYLLRRRRGQGGRSGKRTGNNPPGRGRPPGG